MRTYIVLCLLGLALAKDASLDADWEEFKATYGKNYHPMEEATRRTIWERAVSYIRKHNMEADLGKHTYWVGINEYADLTDEEYRNYLTGYRMQPNSKSASTFLPPENVELPKTVDWRKKGYVTPIKNQGSCGSCWAFSSTGSLEGQHFKKTGKLVSLSEQNLVDCSQKEGNHGCMGGWMDYAFQYVKDNDGIDTEKSYPYKGVDQPCAYKPSGKGATDTGFTDVQSGSEDDLQKAVATVGPISVAIDASHTSFRMYKHGVYNEPACSSTMLDHGVLAVGYGTDNGQKYWLVKNSWGTTWGNKGYIMMSRDKNNQCGIATKASYPMV